MLFQVFETAAKAAIAKKKSYVPSLKLCTLLWKTVALCLSSLIEKVFTLIECRNMHKSTVPGPLTQQCYRIAWLSGIQRLSIAWPSPEPKGILCHGCIWVQSRPSVWLPTRTALLDKSWTFLFVHQNNPTNFCISSLLPPAFLQLSLSTAHAQTDWLFYWIEAAKWALSTDRLHILLPRLNSLKDIFIGLMI